MTFRDDWSGGGGGGGGGRGRGGGGQMGEYSQQRKVETRAGTWWMRMEQNENCRGVEKRVTK